MSVLLTTVLIQPVVTEKTTAMVNKFTFLIHPEASKTDVKMAIKEFYGIDVLKVNVMKNPAKTRLIGRGRLVNRRSEKTKAVVTLKDGQTLDFNAFK